MTKYFIPVIWCLISFSVKAQQMPQHYQPYGKIDVADLKMTACDFEKAANAEVLFDREEISFDYNGNAEILHHKRIKIFNSELAREQANINLPYRGQGKEDIWDVCAETINLKDDNTGIAYTPVDSKLIYQKKIDKYRKAVIFTFPNVKNGSVIEYTYKYKAYFINYIPEWDFQADIPTRYSEISIVFTAHTSYQVAYIGTVKMITIPPTLDTIIATVKGGELKAQTKILALSNIHSLVNEPYMTPKSENLQRIVFKSSYSSWGDASRSLALDDNFGKQLDVKLDNTDHIIVTADSLKSMDLKIDTLYNFVKKHIKCTNSEGVLTDVGVKQAWAQKAGNATEVNMILYNLLTRDGVQSFPMLVNTSKEGYVDPLNPVMSKFTKMVVAAQEGDGKLYILDATDKYANYKTVPYDLLRTWGLAININMGRSIITNIINDLPETQSTYINATIKTDGKMAGTASISSGFYNRIQYLKLYDTLGEEKYKEALTNRNNDIKISKLSMENAAIDSLPLVQNIDFEQELSASDENYIYFNTNLFLAFGENPFKADNRYSDIDFKYNDDQLIREVYNIPANYKMDAVLKNTTLLYGDSSIVFSRSVVHEKNALSVRYVIRHRRVFYPKTEYPYLKEFYRRMYDILNETIVLKKIQ